jgi:hypothetical protein
MTNLVSLTINRCYDFEELPDTLINLKILDLWECPKIQTIPDTFTEMNFLKCSHCPQLRSIPLTFTELVRIELLECPKITEIPSNSSILYLVSCINCRMITYIPDTCVYPLIEGCPWIYDNEDYKENECLLFRCQQIIRKRQFRKKLERVAIQIIPIWWDPSCKGGRSVKREIASDLIGIMDELDCKEDCSLSELVVEQKDYVMEDDSKLAKTIYKSSIFNTVSKYKLKRTRLVG